MERRVLVVEDEVEVLSLLQDVLRMGGFRVIPVNRPELVRDAIATTRPDLFLLDLMLPGMSGVELAQELRSAVSDPVPMIAISASRLMLQLAEDSGHFAATLSKPFDIDTLLSTVERVLGPVDVRSPG